MVVFDQLGREDLAHILGLYLARLNAQLKEKELRIELTGSAEARMLEEGYDPDFGARPMKRVFQRRIQDKLALEMLRGTFRSGQILHMDFDPKREEFYLV
jgi:ATP-dependent Clp protease ATP-binding subunit ClpB